MDHKASIERGGFFLFLALISLGVLLVAWPFATPLLWATLAAIMFQPLYQWILARRPGSANQAAIATLLIITFAVLLPALFIGGVVVEQATALVLAFQAGNIDIAAMFDDVFRALPVQIRTPLDEYGLGDLREAQAKAQELITESAGLIARQAVAIGGSAAGFVLAFGVGLYVTYFLLRDGKAIGANIVASLPLERSVADRLVGTFLSVVRATIKGSVVVGIVQGMLGAITFWIAGVPMAILLGLLMAIFSLLPALGTAIVWIPVAVYLLATGSIWEGIVVVVSGVAVIGMADNVLRPILVGRDTGIPDWIILITTLGGIALMGLSGIVVGPLLGGLFLAGWSILREQREGTEGAKGSGPAEPA